MSQIYMPRGKREKTVPNTAPEIRERTPLSAPASAVGDGMGSKLDEGMLSRFQRHFLNHQIPAAESEADRISAGLGGASTPDAVKAKMGETMGADFSDVSFHTGGRDAGRVDAMGANAYTSGRDVYFGSDGFDPSTAAHELVHTVQQGAVSGSVPTVSAPMGGVQMEPKGKKDIKAIRESEETSQKAREEGRARREFGKNYREYKNLSLGQQMEVLKQPGMWKARAKSKRMFNYRLKDIGKVMEEENTKNPVLILKGMTKKADERKHRNIDEMVREADEYDAADRLLRDEASKVLGDRIYDRGDAAPVVPPGAAEQPKENTAGGKKKKGKAKAAPGKGHSGTKKKRHKRKHKHKPKNEIAPVLEGPLPETYNDHHIENHYYGADPEAMAKGMSQAMMAGMMQGLMMSMMGGGRNTEHFAQVMDKITGMMGGAAGFSDEQKKQIEEFTEVVKVFQQGSSGGEKDDAEDEPLITPQNSGLGSDTNIFSFMNAGIRRPRSSRELEDEAEKKAGVRKDGKGGGTAATVTIRRGRKISSTRRRNGGAKAWRREAAAAAGQPVLAPPWYGSREEEQQTAREPEEPRDTDIGLPQPEQALEKGGEEELPPEPEKEETGQEKDDAGKAKLDAEKAETRAKRLAKRAKHARKDSKAAKAKAKEAREKADEMYAMAQKYARSNSALAAEIEITAGEYGEEARAAEQNAADAKAREKKVKSKARKAARLAAILKGEVPGEKNGETGTEPGKPVEKKPRARKIEEINDADTARLEADKREARLKTAEKNLEAAREELRLAELRAREADQNDPSPEARAERESSADELARAKRRVDRRTDSLNRAKEKSDKANQRFEELTGRTRHTASGQEKAKEKESFVDKIKKDPSGTIKEVTDKIQSVSELVGKANEVLDIDLLGDITDFVGDSASFVGNMAQLVDHSIAKMNLGKRIAEMQRFGIREDDPDAQLKLKTAMLGWNIMGINQVREGTGAARDALSIGAKAAALSGAGLPVSLLLELVSKGVGLAGEKVADKKQKDLTVKEVNQETKLDEKIEELRDAYEKKYGRRPGYHEAKHTVIELMGGESGKRSELFMNIIANRSRELAGLAEKGDEEAAGILKALGVSPGDDNQYDVNFIAERLGIGGKNIEEAIEDKRNSRRSLIARMTEGNEKLKELEAAHADQLHQLDFEYADVSSQLGESNSDQQQELVMQKQQGKAADKKNADVEKKKKEVLKQYTKEYEARRKALIAKQKEEIKALKEKYRL